LSLTKKGVEENFDTTHFGFDFQDIFPRSSW